ncbi:DNA/RNA non-specific endonuclease [Candidatus Bathyarchaeota archaeon]|nr:DNA/RNA non-specific endonuclease [Candidatus Bathyarchaeota archaeon]
MAEIGSSRYKTELNTFEQRRKAVEEKAEKRFRERLAFRSELKAKINLEGLFAVEAESRVNTRLSIGDVNDSLFLERVHGSSDLLGINYLERGMNASRSVCRIQVRDQSGLLLGFGTGFLVSPDLLITNNHVLDSVESARRSLADFNFEDDSNYIPRDTKTFCFDPQRFFLTNEDLDFTLVAVHWQAIDETPLSDFGHLKLVRDSGKALVQEYVTIIQHPEGAAKQVTVRENEIVDLPENCIHYLTDTKPGSSGSPVFNDQWQVVALHHAGVKKRDDRGRVLSIHNDLPWDPATMSEEAIAWVANEGIRVSCIFDKVQEMINNLPPEQQKLAIAAFPTITSGDEEVSEEITLGDSSPEWYENVTGYDPSFLGKDVPLPKIPDNLEKDLAPLKSGTGNVLKYTHFSIVMSKSRRLAFFTAVNIDGNNFVDVERDRDYWYFDPRIETEYQCGPEIYKNNPLDRGHLVRRMDPNWGDEAVEANRDTFHFTNCAPQHKKLNQQTWLSLERYILKNATKYGLKVTIFNGPVFRVDDMSYRGVQVPAEFWKIAVMIKDDGKMSATAYLQTQKNLIEDLEFAYGKYRTYQVPISRIEALTKLNFGKLRDHDPLADVEGALVRSISGPNDIKL